MNDLINQEIEKRKKLTAPSDGMKCEMCSKQFYGVCCSWKV
jgi:hypothetical protein